MRRLPLGFSVIALCAASAVGRSASADDNDLVLSRLALRVEQNGRVTQVIPQSRDFRALASQLGVVIAPSLTTPADTLGWGGVQLAVDYHTTQIDSAAPYWRALEGSPDPAGTSGADHTSGYLSTVGIFARKGLWLPLPSMELGGGVVKLADSSMWAAQAYAKLALHEGYHDVPIPSVALRGAVSRLMTQRELDLTVASFDASLSKSVGLGGTWTLDPYAGYNLLVTVVRSEVVDPTPNVGPDDPTMPNDRALNFVFKDQDPILRHRVFLGAKAKLGALVVTVEGQLALAGSSVDDRADAQVACEPGSMTDLCDSTDIAQSQHSLTVSAGFEL